MPPLAAAMAAYTLLLAVLWWGTADPVAAVLEGTATFETLLAFAAALAAWALAGWIFLVAAVTALARMPGWLGRVALWCADRITPAAARYVVRAVMGLATVAMPLTATAPASAATPESTSVSQCETEAAPAARLPDVGRPAVAVPKVQPEGQRSPSAHTGKPSDPDSGRQREPKPRDKRETGRGVVVRPGATLWSIAADHLGPQAADAEIAAAWPRWFAANADTIGADPDLLRPGLQLYPPERS